jgi:hypothetical protein
MAAWRKRAIESFPELRRALNDRREIWSIYAFWMELRPMVKEAHRQNRTDFLKRAYRFADWCRQQKSKDLWNSVGVSFYEHLFDEKSIRPLVIPWLNPEVVRDHWGLWELRLQPKDLKEIKALVEKGGLGTAWGPLQASGSAKKSGQERTRHVAETRD